MLIIGRIIISIIILACFAALILFSFLKGFFYLTGRRLLINKRTYFILFCLYISGYAFFNFNIIDKFNYSNNRELAYLIYSLIAFLVPFFFAGFYARKINDIYVLPIVTRNEFKMILEGFLKDKGMAFKADGDVFLLGENHDGKIRYASFELDLTKYQDLEFKKELIEYIKTIGKEGSVNIKKGIFCILLGIVALLLIYYALPYLFSHALF